MPDEKTQARQRELEARHRDLTKIPDPPGSTAESLRAIKGFEGITDEMLRERELGPFRQTTAFTKKLTQAPLIDLRTMTPEELRGLAQAAVTELHQRDGAD